MSDTNVVIDEKKPEVSDVKPETIPNENPTENVCCTQDVTQVDDKKTEEIPEKISDEKEQNETTDVKTTEEDVTLSELEQLKLENKHLNTKVANLEKDLQFSSEEKENFKNRNKILENLVTELKNRTATSALNPQQQNAVEKMKKQSEEILTRAKGVIFDKTKLIKHQELQIEALTLQISSMKEVLTITKELLEIRNLEVKELNEKLEFMEQKISGEKIRQDLLHVKMDAMSKLNTDLKSEYEIQLKLFNELRSAYSERDELQNAQKELKNAGTETAQNSGKDDPPSTS